MHYMATLLESQCVLTPKAGDVISGAQGYRIQMAARKYVLSKITQVLVQAYRDLIKVFFQSVLCKHVMVLGNVNVF